MMTDVVSHCQKSPADGASKGLLEEKKRANGVIPSRPKQRSIISMDGLIVHAEAYRVLVRCELARIRR